MVDVTGLWALMSLGSWILSFWLDIIERIFFMYIIYKLLLLFESCIKCVWRIYQDQKYIKELKPEQ